MADKDLDSFRYGAEAIGREAEIFKRDKKTGQIVLDENGRPVVDVRKTHYGLEKGYIDADKFGPRIWRSTPRRIRAA
jgi:hypothetical protein